MNDDIMAALKTVIDPELGINIVDLGLVYAAVRTATGVNIELTMTTPACPLGEMMSKEIKLVLRDRFSHCCMADTEPEHVSRILLFGCN